MKEMVARVDNTQIKKFKKNPEDKQYLVCIRGDSIDDLWDILQGRTAAYDFIKDYIGSINLEESFVLVEENTLLQRISVYAFMKRVQDNYMDGFDIEDYVDGDWSETNYKINNNIIPDPEIEEKKLSIEDIMAGNIEFSDIPTKKDED